MALAGSEKSKWFVFLIISNLFMIVSLWSVYDEAVVRRPWKQFQEQFNELQVNLAEKKLNDVQQKFVADGVDKKLKELAKELESAEAALESKEYNKLKSDFDAMQIVFDDAVLEIKFNKSTLDAYYYDWKHAFQHGGSDAAANEKKYRDLEANINDKQKKLDELEGRLGELKKAVNVYDERVTNLSEQIVALNKPLDEAQKVVANIGYRTGEIQQVVIPDLGIQGNIYWGKVDRCQTCHVAADMAGFEDVTQAFGLTVVKDEVAAKEVVKKDSSLKGFVVSEKQLRHYQIMYGTHPKRDELFGNHPVEKYGCTSCHGGDGRGLQIRGLEFGESEHKEESHGHGGVSTSGFVQGVFGAVDKVHATHHHGIEPLLRGKQMEANCLSCHTGQLYIAGAPTVTKGINLFVDLGCQGCHLVQGYDKLYKTAPELNKVASKVDKTWLADWLKNPKNYLPNSRMPMFGLSDDDVAAVGSFLLANSQEHQIKNQSASLGNVQNGKKIFETVGCQGCHSADDTDEAYSTRGRAPNLARLAAKVTSPEWVYDWILNPKNYAAHARMPDLRLTPSEASDVTAYLMSQNMDYKQVIKDRSAKLAARFNPNDEGLVHKGKAVMTARGCYACHDIKGFEGMDRIGPELTGEANKETFELDFGDALTEAYTFTDVFGKKTFVAHNTEAPGGATAEIQNNIKSPDGVDAVTNLENTWQSWIRNKIKYPTEIYSHARADLKMPNFDLSPDELDALVTFLKSMRKREIPLRYDATKTPHAEDVLAGQRLVGQYNCMGCHGIHGFGGEIVNDIDKQVGDKKPQFYPPTLDHVGIKIRPEWLHQFLDRPTPYRQALTVRMPTFGFTDDEINKLMRYFAGINKVSPGLTSTKYSLSADYIAAARHVASPEAYNCFSCHFYRGKGPGEDPTNWAPDWADMKDRLQYDFITKWIKAPASYQKFAVMPGFLNSDDEALPDQLGGKAEEQLKALRDFVLEAAP